MWQVLIKCFIVCVWVGGVHKSIHLLFVLEYMIKYQDYLYTTYLIDMYRGIILKYILLAEYSPQFSVWISNYNPIKL